jgi:predicted DNA-binding transcriptional regulator YafY
MMRADRLLSLVLILQSNGGMTAEELAVQLEVSERTIYRDIEALSFAGIPIYTHPGVRGGIFLDEGYRSSVTSLTNAEAQTIVLTSEAAPFHDLGMEKAASGMLLKLLSALPAAQRDAAERLRQRIHIDPTGWFHTTESVPFLPLLHKVVWEDRVIELSYQRPDGVPTQRELHPYALIAKANVWYLVGKQIDGEMRTFRVSRIQDVSVHQACFQRPQDFDLSGYWQAQCALFEKQMLEGEIPCEVLVRIHPDGLRSLVSDLSGQYERLSAADPQEWVVLRINFDSRENAQMRMQAFGSRVEVLEPDWLRQRLLQEALAVARRYGG